MGISFWLTLDKNKTNETIEKTIVCKHIVIDMVLADLKHYSIKSDGTNRQSKRFHNQRKTTEKPDTQYHTFTFGYLGNYLVFNAA